MSRSLQSSLLAAVPASESIAAAQRVRELKAAGRDIISLTIGEPDFATPPAVIEAAFAAAREGQTRYTPIAGTLRLRQAIADKFKRENSLVYDPATEVFTASGAKQIIYDVLTATLDPGDEVVIFSPYWVSYPTIVRLVGARPVFVMASAASGFIPTPEELEQAISPRTKWVLMNFPNNPTGAVASAAQYAGIAAVLERHPDILVMSDEIYEHIRFDGTPFVSFANTSEAMKSRTLVVNGISKAYAMTGWRIGYAAGPRTVIAAMSKLQSHVTGGACSISQAAAVAALDSDPAPVRERSAIYQQRRDLVLGRLAACKALQAFRPSGAFYVFCQVLDTQRMRGANIEDFLIDHGVAVIGGEGFGLPGWFRMSIATSHTELERACDRIVGAFAKE